jgi:hypothetical protein
MLAGVAGFGLGLYHLVKTGTCASGGPYETVRPCPSGTGAWIGALIGGIFVFLVGGAVFATRGRRATEPGLPPIVDEIHANPPPFSRFYGDADS